MIREAAMVASAILLLARIPDGWFVRAADGVLPLPSDDLEGADRMSSRMLRAAAWSIVAGLAPPAAALLCLPARFGLPLAAAASFAAACDWLLSFCGARVRATPTPEGTLFRRIPPEHRPARLAEALLKLLLLALAALFAAAAISPPSGF